MSGQSTEEMLLIYAIADNLKSEFLHNLHQIKFSDDVEKQHL